MKKYNWQQPDWPHFRYDLTIIHEMLFCIAEKTGYLKGKFSHLSEHLQTETVLNLMVEEAIKTSEIEGEYISRPDVRSSINNKLGLNKTTAPIHDKRARGVAELMIDVRNTFQEPLQEQKLFDWHLLLLSATPNKNIQLGYWRTHEESMQIVSGYHDKWDIHFEAPPSKDIPKEMAQFIQWFNDTAPRGQKLILSPPVRAAIAHLYFESIHPFEDGNGRVGRAIAEKALSQGAGGPILLSLSQVIEADKKAYYSALNSASQSNDITNWIAYFVNVIFAAQIEIEKQINFILNKALFFDKFSEKLNERQLKVVKRMMEAGIKGFEGGMSAKKYVSITGTSKATATRDLHDLLLLGIFTQIGDGRSTRYELNL